MSKRVDFIDLWKKGGDGAPKASIIGGLQKLLNTKDAELLELKEENRDLRAQITENISLLDEAEKVIADQTEEIEKMKSGFISVDDHGKKILRPSMSGSKGSDSKADAETMQRMAVYEQQIRSLEEKLYIYSNLPDRIAALESQKEDLTKKMDQYIDREESLRATIKKLSTGMDNEDAFNALQTENENLKDRIKKMQEQKGSGATLGGDFQQMDSLQNQLKKTETEKKFLQQQLNEIMSQKSDMEAKLFDTQNAMRTLQSSGNSGPSQQQVLEYQKQIAVLRQELSIVKGENPNFADPKVLQRDLDAIRSENAQLKRELEEKSKAQPINEFIQDLQSQVNKLKMQNKRLEDELKQKS